MWSHRRIVSDTTENGWNNTFCMDSITMKSFVPQDENFWRNLDEKCVSRACFEKVFAVICSNHWFIKGACLDTSENSHTLPPMGDLGHNRAGNSQTPQISWFETDCPHQSTEDISILVVKHSINQSSTESQVGAREAPLLHGSPFFLLIFPSLKVVSVAGLQLGIFPHSLRWFFSHQENQHQERKATRKCRTKTRENSRWTWAL